MYVWTPVRTLVRTHVSMDGCMDGWGVDVWMDGCMTLYLYTCTLLSILVYAHASIHVYYVDVYTCILVYVYSWILYTCIRKCLCSCIRVYLYIFRKLKGSSGKIASLITEPNLH